MGTNGAMTALHPVIGGENESNEDGDTAASQLDSSESSFLPGMSLLVGILHEQQISLGAPFPVYQDPAWLACL